jgi:hypothetical protein
VETSFLNQNPTSIYACYETADFILLFCLGINKILLLQQSMAVHSPAAPRAAEFARFDKNPVTWLK